MNGVEKSSVREQYLDGFCAFRGLPKSSALYNARAIELCPLICVIASPSSPLIPKPLLQPNSRCLLMIVITVLHRARDKCSLLFPTVVFFLPSGVRGPKALNFDQVLGPHNPTGDCASFLASARLPSGVVGLKGNNFCALNPTVVFFLPSGKLGRSIYPSPGTINVVCRACFSSELGSRWSQRVSTRKRQTRGKKHK